MVIACCNARMKDVSSIRREHLAALVREHGLTAVATRMQRSVTQVSDMVAGRKSFGEKVARAMELAWDPSRSPGWLDVQAGELPKLQPAPRDAAPEWPFARLPLTRLQRLTDNQLRGIEDAMIKQVDAFLGDSEDKSPIKTA